ncbi:sensor histidine kinase [Spirochaetia bacterium]|nr:sensor histidine kinase [Spirochaetia bacterium]
MKEKFTISLQNRLALIYALFISLALVALTIIINIFTGIVFTSLVKTNIAGKSAEIVRAIEDQYNPMSRSFDTVTLEAMGMYFVHEGYIVTVEDEEGGLVWDARSCDMRECTMVLNDIADRMEGRFGFRGGALRKDQYPIRYPGGEPSLTSVRSGWVPGRTVGTVSIETYGPFFYSETESAFLTSINRLLVMATIILTFASFMISIILSRAIARPVNKSAEAARQIAEAHSGGASGKPIIRIDDRYQTRELGELARSINSLAAELEEAERKQKQLTSDIAHELRTPLTCLRGGIEAMIDGVYKPDREHLESCLEETIRLAGLVQDLNTLTALEWENITINKTEFDLGSLLRITAEQFKAAAIEKGIEIKLDLMESPVNADYDRLKQVFINLLSNAVKYTDRGSVTVSVEKSGVSGSQWEVSITDTGIGIPETDLPHVFERFYRSDKSRNRSTGGAGIGLTIAAAIVHAHGGVIQAESAETGSVFKVAL